MSGFPPVHDSGPFRRFVDGLPDSVAIDEGGALTYLNPKFVEQLGLEAAQAALGRPMVQVLDSELEADELSQLDSAIETARTLGDGATTELRLVFTRRVERVVEVSIHTQRASTGTVLVFTLKEELTAHGVRAALEHTDRLASLGTLAAGVAHEINNPLAYVVSNLGYSIEQLIRIKSQLSSSLPDSVQAEVLDNLTHICEALEEAGEGTDRVARIVQGLKSFSRSEGESRGPVDLTEVLNSAANIAENEIRYRARLERAYTNTPLVFGNEARLVQVFVNLLVNAAQAIPENNLHTHRIRVCTAVSPNGRVVVEVSDTGVGIPQDVVDRVFDPFFTTKPIGVGTGLGLSICHGLIHGLGGSISVVSEERRGTTFRVELLPAEPRDRGRSPASDTPSAVRGQLLIIDDEPLVLRAFRRTLAPQHNVLTVSDAKKALDLIEKGQGFDLIFCDLMMPGMTGMDFHATLSRAEPDLAERVVFLTGGAFTSSARAYLNSVPNRALEKPLHPRDLRSFVTKALA